MRNGGCGTVSIKASAIGEKDYVEAVDKGAMPPLGRREWIWGGTKLYWGGGNPSNKVLEPVVVFVLLLCLSIRPKGGQFCDNSRVLNSLRVTTSVISSASYWSLQLKKSGHP